MDQKNKKLSGVEFILILAALALLFGESSTDIKRHWSWYACGACWLVCAVILVVEVLR
jgi:hypothetical protein